MSKEIFIEPELLWALYWGNQYSSCKIAEMTGCANSNIWYKLKKHDIPIRNHAEANPLIVDKEINKNARKKMALTKKRKYLAGELNIWNKGIKKEDDARIVSGEKHPRWKGGDVLLICDFCGNTFKRKKAEINYTTRDGWKHVYCCRKCQGKGARLFNTQSGKNNGFWKGGHFPYYGCSWNKIKIKILLERGGSSQISGKGGVDVHHIVPVRVFVNKFIENCLKPYIQNITIDSFKILPYELIPDVIFNEVNNENNLMILTRREHREFENMPQTFFDALKEVCIN